MTATGFSSTLCVTGTCSDFKQVALRHLFAPPVQTLTPLTPWNQPLPTENFYPRVAQRYAAPFWETVSRHDGRLSRDASEKLEVISRFLAVQSPALPATLCVMQQLLHQYCDPIK